MPKCSVCAGYDSHKCPCCRPEPDWPMDEIGQAIDDCILKIRSLTLPTNDHVYDWICEWVDQNIQPEHRDQVAEFIQDEVRY